MPILTEPDPHLKRRRPWLWVLLGVPGVVLALLAGLAAWTWDHPVRLFLGARGIQLTHSTEEVYDLNGPSGPGPIWEHGPGYGAVAVKLPGGQKTGWYVAGWFWQ